MDAYPPLELAGWIALQEQDPRIEPADQQLRVATALRQAVQRNSLESLGKDVSGEAAYLHRAWSCVEYHWRAFAENAPIPFAEVISRVEEGELHYGHVAANVLLDVLFAAGLQSGEPAAARRFDSDYMPLVHAIARRIGGQRVVESVDNFSAELVLPRQDGQPRIAKYAGRTSLAHWLRSVVVNYLVSQARGGKMKIVPLIGDWETRADGSPQMAVEHRECVDLLYPLFAELGAELPAEDRLLLKMLVLDGVPQGNVARAQGVNTGTITRRRQRAAASICARLKQWVADPGHPGASECLDLVLSENHAELRGQVASLLAESIRSAEGTTAEEHPA